MSGIAPSGKADDRSFEALLHRDERVLWRGRPSPRAAIRGQVASNVLVSLPFLTVVGIMAAGAGFGPQTLFYAVLFGLGLWQLSRPFRFYRQAARTLYAVTDRRVLIVTTAGAGGVHEIHPEKIRDVLLKAFADGKGHLYFSLSRVGRLQVRYERVGFRDGFWGIDDPRDAWQAIRSLQARGFTPLADALD